MLKTNSDLYEVMKEHLAVAKTLKNRITDLDSSDKIKTENFYEKVSKSPFDLSLTKSAWSVLIKSLNAQKKIQQIMLNSEVVQELLEYQNIDELTAADWDIVSSNQELFLQRVSTAKDAINHINDWIVPVVLYSIVNKSNDEEYQRIVFKCSARHGFQETWQKETKLWGNHMTTNMVLSIFLKSDITLNQLRWLLPSEEIDVELLALIENIFANFSREISDATNVIKGLLRIDTKDSIIINSILKNRGEEEAILNFAYIGETVYTTIPTSALKRLANNNGNIQQVLYGDYNNLVDVVYNAYSNSEKREKFTKLIQKAALDNKKAFLSLISNNYNEISGIKYDSSAALIQDDFYRIVNVNTLNLNMIKSALDLHWDKSVLEDVKESITYQELEFLIGANNIHRALYHKIEGMRVDDKLRILKQIPNVTWIDTYRFTSEEFLTRLSNEMIKKGFMQSISQWIEGKSISKEGGLLVELFKEEFGRVIDEIKTDYDIKNLLSYEIQANETLVSFKDRIYKDVKEIESFKKFLGASSSFIRDNLSRLYSFYEQGLMKVVLTYKETLDNKQQNNLKLLCKAEIAGKLSEVKYREDDYVKELGYEVSSDIKQIWKTDTSSTKGKYRIAETSNFNDLIRMGEVPTVTCMHWEEGSYRSCLLSIFDLNKRLIVVEKNGQIVARAVLRLTKVNENTKQKDTLGFIDVETVDVDNNQITNSSERLVLFLERFYTTFTGGERTLMKREVVALVNKKAKELGIELILHTGYSDVAENAEVQALPIYISHSKNGLQYLDSLDGEANESDGGTYFPAKVLLLQS